MNDEFTERAAVLFAVDAYADLDQNKENVSSLGFRCQDVTVIHASCTGPIKFDLKKSSRYTSGSIPVDELRVLGCITFEELAKCIEASISGGDFETRKAGSKLVTFELSDRMVVVSPDLVIVRGR